MRLFFDIGNSRCKYVLDSEGTLTDIKYQTVDKIDNNWLSEMFPDVSHCLVADVANSDVCTIIKVWCDKHSISYQLLVSQSENNGVRCAYDSPSSFGIDRWLALLGVNKIYSQTHCLIIDAGTATTLDYLDDTGQHQGGWILGGIDSLVTSLLANTANVQGESKMINALSFASNTSDGVNHAAWAASLGIIEQAYFQVIKQSSLHKKDLKVIFTGGNAKELHRHFREECIVVEDLIFVGMQCYNN